MKTCRVCGETKPSSDFYEGAARCKPCVKAATRKWRQENPDRQRAADKARYEQDSEKIKARIYSYRAENPEKVQRSRKQHYERHGEKVREKSRQRYRDDPAKARSEVRKRYENEPGPWIDAYARQRLLSPELFIASVRKREIYARDEGRCGICGTELTYEEATIDHVHPLSKGGTHGPDNVQIACDACNKSKRDKLDHAAAPTGENLNSKVR